MTDSGGGGCDVLFTVTDVISTRFLAPLAAELAARGRSVGVATNLHGKPPPAGLRAHLSMWHDLAMRRPPSPGHDARALGALTRVVRSSNPKVMHASTPKAGLLGVLAGRLARVPTVLTQLRGLRSEHASGAGGRIQRASEAVTLRAADVVIANSASLLAATRAAGLPVPPDAIVVGRGSSTGVDTARFRPRGRSLDPNAPVLGFVGRLHTDKGAGVLPGLVAALRRDHPGLTLIVAGDADPADPRGGALEAELAATDGVELVGWSDDVAAFLDRIDVLVFPSMREGLPNAPLEAQAAGVPVVGYAATGTVDAVENDVGGLLVDVGDTRALCAAVSRVVADPHLAAALGAGGRAFVEEHFDSGVVVSAHADLLEELIDGPGHRRR